MTVRDKSSAEEAWDLTSPTRPDSCILLNCLPIDRTTYVRDFRAWPMFDFVRSASGEGSPEEAWTSNGAELANLVVALIEAARSCEVRTVAAATKADFIEAFGGGKSVIIVLAHWKGSRLLGRDILADPSEVVASMAGVPLPNFSPATIDAVLGRCRVALGQVSHLVNAVERREDFASRLNDLIIQDPTPLPGLFPSELEEGLVVGDIWLETWHRNALDAMARSKIAPGNCIEFRDGLQNPVDLAQQVPASWKGLVDLTMCQSVILGHLIKMGRADRGILTRRKPLDAAIAVTILRRLIVDIGTGKYNYISRYLELFRETSKLVQHLVDSND
jgi:hypothetical protein